MARKDVDLVIRAKDEASQALDSIAKAFKALTGGADELTAGGRKAEGALGTLTKALDGLDKGLKGVSATDKLSKELADAAAAMGRLQAETAQTQSDLSKLGRSQAQAAAQTERFTAKMDGAAAALAKQAREVSKQEKAFDGYRVGLREAERDLGKLETRQRAIAKQLPAAAEGADKAALRYKNLSAAVAATEKPTNTLVARLEKSSVSANNAAAKLDRLKAAQTALAGEIENASAAVAKQSANLDRSTAAVARASTVYGKIKANAAELAASLRATETNQARVAGAVERTTNALARQTSAINRAEVEYGQLTAAAGKAAGAIQEFVGGARGSLEQSIRQQGQALAESRRELLGQEKAIRDYAAALAATEAPTERMTRDLTEARAAARQMRAELAVQERALRDMREVLKGTASDYEGVTGAQRRFQGIKSTAGEQVSGIRGASTIAADLERSRQAASQSSADLLKARDAANELSVAFARIGPPTREQAAAMDQARTAVRAHREALAANGTAAAQLTGIYDRARAGVISFEQAERQAASVSGQLSAALARIKAESSSLAANTTRAAGGVRSIGSASQDAKAKTESLAGAFRNLFGAQHESLSIAGRLRAQVIALTSAYVGLYGAFSGIQATVRAFQTIEAATSRLNVVFNGDKSKVGTELDFLRRTADRLKISFGDLSDQYTKFAVATKNTNLEGANTRKIFVAVSEAARVYKLNQEDVNGVFTALTQIASKGRIQLEELSQQLGDRLPGALQILADGMGITTTELLKLTAAGEVSSDQLVKFAENITKRTADQLPSALEGLTSSFGAFSNAVFEALVRLGNGGFIQALQRTIDAATKALQSADAASFIDRLSAGLGKLADLATVLVENFRLVGAAIAALIGLKIGQWTIAAYGAFAKLATNIKVARAEFNSVAASATTAGAATTRFGGAAAGAAAGARALGLGVRALVSSTLIGAVFTAAAVALEYFLTSATDANTVLIEHQRIIDEVKNAYDKSDGSLDKFRKGIEGISVSQLQDDLDKLKDLLGEVRSEASSVFDRVRASALNSGEGFFIDPKIGEQAEKLDDLATAFKRGESKASDFKKAIDEIARSALTPEIKDYALALQEVADRAAVVEKGIADAENAIKAKTGTDVEATKALEDLQGATEATAEAMAIKATLAAEKFRKSLEKIKDFIPDLKKDLDNLADMKELQLAIDALGAGPRTKEQQDIIDAATRNVQMGGSFEKVADDVVKSPNGVDSSARLLRFFEDFRSDTYYDVNHYRTGYGSDTITDASGKPREVQKGDTVTIEEANRDLVRRIGEFQDSIKKLIGADRFAQFSPAQQAALTSIAYNYGTIGTSKNGRGAKIDDTVRTGSNADIAKAIRGLASQGPFKKDGTPVNASRRNREAGLFERGGDAATKEDIEDQVKAGDKQAAAEAKKAEAAADYNEQKQLRIGQLEDEAKGEGVLSLQATVQKAVEAERLKAKKAGVELSKEDEQRITAATTAEYKRTAAERATKEEKEAIAKQEEIISNLETKRSELQKQLQIYKTTGDNSGVTATEEAIKGVNAELLAAIDNANKFYESVSGDKASANMLKLKTTALEIKTAGQQTFLDWQKVGELFGNGLTNAFDQFAQAVAEGKNVGEAAREAFLQFAGDFLRQIAQMIIKWAVFNAIKSVFPGFSVGVSHAGGMAGRSNRTREVNPAIFAAAPRFHSGGLPGLARDEVPAILQMGEEVLDKDDPRNILNGGAGVGGRAAQAAPNNVKVVNAFDSASMLSEALGTPAGEKVILNYVRQNKAAFRGAMS